MEKNTFKYSISKDELDNVFKTYFENLGYKDVEIGDINYHIDSKPKVEGNELKITFDLLCSMISFKSSGLEK